MKGETLTVRWNNIVSIVIGIVVLVFVIIVLAGIIGPVTRESWVSFTVLLVIGGIGCVVSSVHSSIQYKQTKWRLKRLTHPVMITSHALGILALLLVIFTHGGTNIGFFTGYATASVALAVIVFVKIGLNVLKNTMLKRNDLLSWLF